MAYPRNVNIKAIYFLRTSEDITELRGFTNQKMGLIIVAVVMSSSQVMCGNM